MSWIITNDQDEAWSNAYGWVEDDYDTFSDEEKENLQLPMGGKWERVPWTVEQ